MTEKIYQSMKAIAITGLSIFAQSATAQISLEMGATGASTTTNGPLATQSITLFEDGTAAYTPTTTVTYTFSNQQYGLTTVEGMPTYLAANFGLTSPVTQNNTTPATTPLYNLMNFVGSPLDNMFTACPTCTPGTGMSVTSNYAAEMMIFTDALITAATANKVAVNQKVQMADLTITFNRPVSNPVIHFAGLGGQRSITSAAGNTYGMGFTGEFEMIGTIYPMTKLSGTSTLNVSGVNITNTATYLGSSSQGTAAQGITRTGASGSVLVTGSNITTLTFRVYLRGDGGRITNAANQVVAAESAAWFPTWALGATNPGGVTGSITGEAATVGVSLLRPVTVAGTVFRDKNGGNVDNSSGSANNITTGLFANLIDAAGKVVASLAVPATGDYSFPGIGAGTYTVNISTTQGSQAGNAPTVALPANWVNTGEFNGIPNTGNDGTPNGISAAFTVAAADVSNINFGIQQRPTANAASQTITTPANQTIAAGTVTTAVTGSDPEDGAYTSASGTLSIVVDTLPANAVMRYNGTIVAAGATIANFNPALLSFTAIAAGSTAARFSYSILDAATTKSNNSVRYTISWSTPLPLKLVSFAVHTAQCSADITWVTNNERELRKFAVEYSKDAMEFEQAGNPIPATNSPGEHTYTLHLKEVNGNNYYRLAMYENDGRVNYSNIVKAIADCNLTGLGNWTASPNPLRAQQVIALNYTGAAYSGQVAVTIYNTLGQNVYNAHQHIDETNGKITLTNAALSAGQYVINITVPGTALKTIVRLVVE